MLKLGVSPVAGFGPTYKHGDDESKSSEMPSAATASSGVTRLVQSRGAVGKTPHWVPAVLKAWRCFFGARPRSTALSCFLNAFVALPIAAALTLRLPVSCSTLVSPLSIA